MSKFNIGDRPWLASAGVKQVEKACPVCAGKKTVELIIGTGEHIILPCDYCGKGWEGPRGFVMEYEYTTGAEQLTVTRTVTRRTEEGESSEYHFASSRYANDDDLFATEEEALAQCQAWIAQKEIDERTRAEYIKKDQAKTYSWNAGYHLREAKREEESAARHRERAAICKAKAKGGAT